MSLPKVYSYANGLYHTCNKQLFRICIHRYNIDILVQFYDFIVQRATLFVLYSYVLRSLNRMSSCSAILINKVSFSFI